MQGFVGEWMKNERGRNLDGLNKAPNRKWSFQLKILRSDFRVTNQNILLNSIEIVNFCIIPIMLKKVGTVGFWILIVGNDCLVTVLLSFFPEDPMLAQVAFMASMEVLNGKLANSQPLSDLQGTLQRPPPAVEAIIAWPPCQQARPLGKAFIINWLHQNKNWRPATDIQEEDPLVAS